MADLVVTPAGEAMREAVARQIRAWANRFGALRSWSSLADTLLKSGPIASELARLTADRDQARANLVEAGKLLFDAKIANDFQVALIRNITARADAAEAALTNLRADHAAEVARLRDELKAAP